MHIRFNIGTSFDMAKTRGAKDIDEGQQKVIIQVRKQGRTQKDLTFGTSISTVTKFLKRWKIQGYYVKKEKTGRPRCITSFADRNIVRTSRSNPRLTVPDIAEEILIPQEYNPSTLIKS